MGNGVTKNVGQLEALLEENSELWLADIRGGICSDSYEFSFSYG